MHLMSDMKAEMTPNVCHSCLWDHDIYMCGDMQELWRLNNIGDYLPLNPDRDISITPSPPNEGDTDTDTDIVYWPSFYNIYIYFTQILQNMAYKPMS